MVKPFKFTIGHLFILLGLFSAVLTFILFRTLVTDQPKEVVVEKPRETTDVVVAKRYITAGEVIRADDIVTVQWPKDFLPSANWVVIYSDPQKVVGHAARIDIVPTQPIYEQSLEGSVSTGGLTARVPKGMRAMTIGVSEIKGVGGFVRPGDRVDVLATFDYSGMSGTKSLPLHLTQTVLQDVLVLAVAQNMTAPTPEGNTMAAAQTTVNAAANEAQQAKDMSEGKNPGDKAAAPGATLVAASVTVAVSPQEGQVLTLAESQGQLKLSLRAENDQSKPALTASSEGDLFRDMSVFDNLYSYVLNQTSFADLNTAPGVTGGGGGEGGGNKAAGLTIAPNLGAPTAALPSSGKRIQLIQGTQISDVYLQH